jgi:uncharacterized protein YwgA
MTKNFKWGVESFNDAPIHVVLFISRNKDNKDVEGFKERRHSFITRLPSYSEELMKQFEAFVNSGVNGEMSRMYYSINARNAEKIYKELLIFLISNPEFNLCSIQPKLAGIAAKKECASEKHWFFDFDIDSEEKVEEFKQDILAIAATPETPINVIVHKTPNGYAVITNRGFDTRPLYEKWRHEVVSLKRDDLLCYKWLRKEN